MERRRFLLLSCLSRQYRQQLFNNIFHTSVPDFVDNKKVRNQGTAKLVSLIGNGEIENQWYNYTYLSERYGITINVVDGVINITGTSNNTGNGPVFAWTDLKLPVGHKFIIQKDFDLPTGDYIFDQYNGAASTDATKLILTVGSNGYIIPQLKVANTNVQYNITNGHIFVIDLTQRYGAGEEPTNINDPRIKRILANKNPFNTGTYKSTIVDEIAFEGFNIWGEEWEVGGINGSDGTNSNSNDRIRSKNYIEVEPNTTYYAYSQGMTSNDLDLFFYDENNNYISHTDWIYSGTFATPSNCAYIRFVRYRLTTYSSGICIYKANNDWDEQVELGELDAQGQDVANTTKLRSVGYTSVSPNKPYYFSIPSGFNFYVCFYDASKNFITSSNVNSFTTPNNARYLRFNLASTYGTTYKGDIIIFEVRGYVPFISPFMPRFYKPLEAGSVKNSFKATVGGYIFDKKVGSYTFTGNETWEAYGSGYRASVLTNRAVAINLTTIPNLSSNTGLIPTTRNDIANGNSGICVSEDYVFISNTSNLTGKTIYYELATSQTITIPCNKMNLVDLGSLSWGYNSTDNIFYTDGLSSIIAQGSAGVPFNMISSLYKTISNADLFATPSVNLAIAVNNYNRINVRNTSYTDATTFKNAMKGVYLYYETVNPLNEFANNVLEKTMAIQLQAPVKLNGALDSHDEFSVENDAYVFTHDNFNVDFGTLNYTRNQNYEGNYVFEAELTYAPNSAYTFGICSKYVMSTISGGYDVMPDKVMVGRSNGLKIYIRDDSYTDATTFKNAMSGVSLQYKLATPQTIRIPRKHLGWVRLKDLSWGKNDSSDPAHTRFYATITLTSANTSNSTVANMFISKYKSDSVNNVYNHTVDMIIGLTSNTMQVYDSSKTNMTAQEFGNSLNDYDILFYETSEEVEDFLVDKNTLPDDYQKVEYIESTGTQYILSGVQLPSTADVRFSGTYMYVGTQSSKSIFGSQQNPNISPLFWLNGERVLKLYLAQSYDGDVLTYDINTKLSFDLTTTGNNYTLKFYNQTYSGTFTQGWCQKNIAIFGNNFEGVQQMPSARLYNFKMEVNNVLVRNFIPCYKKSTGEIGLFDLVTRQFFTNQGTGTFLKGQDVIEYKNEAIFQRGGTFTTNEFEWVENQMVESGNFDSSWGSYWSTGSTISVSNNIATITNPAQYGGISQTTSTISIQGHKYLQSVYVKTQGGNCRLRYIAGSQTTSTRIDNESWQIVSQIITAENNSIITVNVSDYKSTTTITQLTNMILVDLTLGFGAGKEPSSVNDWRIQYIIKYGYLPYNSAGTYKVVNSEVLANAILKLQVK